MLLKYKVGNQEPTTHSRLAMQEKKNNCKIWRKKKVNFYLFYTI